MGKTKKSNNYIIDTKTICCLIVIFTLTISLIVVSNTNKKTNNSEVIEQGGTIIDDGDDDIEYSLNTDLLPLIRLSKYDEATGEREGIVVTNNGTIFSYEFNELNVIYPASDVFAVNQTLYIDHFVDELGIVEDEDLTLLITYAESIDNDYGTDDMVFDTVGNSISVTNYNKEDIYVLINNEGIVNTNENTQLILNILNKYNISL